MKLFTTVLTLMISVTLASPVAAQGKQPERTTEVPKEHLPPPGMCRIWIDGVPPNKQPASTDCTTAVKNRPSNGRVLFGDDYTKSDKRKPSSLIKNFTDGAKDDKQKRPDTAKPPVVVPRKPD
jgi:hypothetical protein